MKTKYHHCTRFEDTLTQFEVFKKWNHKQEDIKIRKCLDERHPDFCGILIKSRGAVSSKN